MIATASEPLSTAWIKYGVAFLPASISPLSKCRNDPIRAAGNRNHIKLKPFADEKSLALGDRQGKRRQAARGGRILPVA